METVFIIVSTIVAVVLIEAVAYLLYKVFNMNKELKKTVDNLGGLSECVLEMVKRMPDVDVLEEKEVNANDFDFPGV